MAATWRALLACAIAGASPDLGLAHLSAARGAAARKAPREGERSRQLLDEGWKFFKMPTPIRTCTQDMFPENVSGQSCMGPRLIKQAQAYNVQTCMETCCGDHTCDHWQWCDWGSKTCSPAGGCYTGEKGVCEASEGWVSHSREAPKQPTPLKGTKCKEPECSVTFDDSDWQTVQLPHDMLIDGTFNQAADMNHGYLPYTKGWYRLHFEVPDEAKGKAIWIDFDGVQRNSLVYLNGHLLGSHASGYTPFRFDISDGALYGDANVLAVFVDATEPDSWWYDGGGIYRHVWLNVADKVHIAPWGVYLPALLTSAVSPQGRADANVVAQAVVVNEGTHDVTVTIKMLIFDDAGSQVASEVTAEQVIEAGGNKTFTLLLQLRAATLWSVETPYLYSAETSLIFVTGQTIDKVSDTFGVRKLAWSKANGFFLNDKPVKIKGFANHQDFAGVGVAVPDSLQGWRVDLLQKMGSNAWRTAHNPPNEALLDECDRRGMLVWDENHRNRVIDQFADDLRALILRDRNHPSVILWSICNEALCDGFDQKNAEALKPIIKELDPLGQRPVTSAMNFDWWSNFTTVMDVVGVNYAIGQYDPIHYTPNTGPLIASETSSDYSDRSVYVNDAVDRKYVSAYDVNFPKWGATAEDAWCAIASRDFVAGGFYWTAFDYKGEPTPYDWPNVNSHFGVIDIAGFPKDNYYYHQSVFFDPQEKPIVHLLPHWNWADVSNCSGSCHVNKTTGQKSVDVWAYTNGDEVELFLNDASLGKKSMVQCRHVEWQVPFSPGVLRAQAYLNGAPHASAKVETTGPAKRLGLEVEWPSDGALTADGTSSALVTVSLLDEAGRLVPTASAAVTFTLSGPGRIIGLGNGDPSCHEPDKPASPTSGTRTAWNGLGRVVLQSTKVAGRIVLEAQSPDLAPATIAIPTKLARAHSLFTFT